MVPGTKVRLGAFGRAGVVIGANPLYPDLVGVQWARSNLITFELPAALRRAPRKRKSAAAGGDRARLPNVVDILPAPLKFGVQSQKSADSATEKPNQRGTGPQNAIKGMFRAKS